MVFILGPGLPFRVHPSSIPARCDRPPPARYELFTLRQEYMRRPCFFVVVGTGSTPSPPLSMDTPNYSFLFSLLLPVWQAGRDFACII
jgi:hypothetical protein